MNLTEQETVTTGHWRELWSSPYLRTSAVISGGVVLYSTNEFVTISMLPSTVNEIGGERIYAWVTTLYLVGSVVAAATVNTLLHRIGACVSYLLGFAVLSVGSLVCAAAPNMEILLVGRFLQGLAGGLLCGLSFAVINAVLPRSLWSRASAMAASTWGVGALLGPALGGFFAQFGAWRWAFGLLAMLSVAMALLAPGVLSADSGDQGGDVLHVLAADLRADLGRVGIEHARDVEAVVGERRLGCDRRTEPPGADQHDVVLARGAQDLADLGDQEVDVVPHPALAELAEAGQVAPDLGGVHVRVLADLLRRDRLTAHLLRLGEHLQVARKPGGDADRQAIGFQRSLLRGGGV